MLRYTTDRARPGLVALYDNRPGNGAGPFLQPRSSHGAQFGEDRCTQFRVVVVTDPQTNKPTDRGDYNTMRSVTISVAIAGQVGAV